MAIQILIAENDPQFNRTTREFLEEKFEVISAETPNEGRFVVDSKPLLGALVIDKRLADDTNERDSSGDELAQYAQRAAPARAPIIMYSTFAPASASVSDSVEPKSNGHLPRITELSKDAPLEVLAEQILSEIHLNLRDIPNLEDIPRYHQPPILAYSSNNGIELIAEELKKSGVTAEILPNEDELKTAVTIYPSALVAVNVTGEADLNAIKWLTKNRDIPHQLLYIVALTSDDRFREPAARAGVNTTIIRQSPEADALDLYLHWSKQKTAMAEQRVTKGLRELYRQLLAQLAGPRSGTVSSSLGTIESALNWPFPTANEKLILVSLHTRLLRAGEDELDQETRSICVEGASMLAQDAARDAEVQDWIDRASRLSPDFSFSWIKDDTLSGDAQEDDTTRSRT